MGAFVSPDGRWRVEALTERGQFWYRIRCDGDLVADNLVIGGVERRLRYAGAPDWASFIEEHPSR